MSINLSQWHLVIKCYKVSGSVPTPLVDLRHLWLQDHWENCWSSLGQIKLSHTVVVHLSFLDLANVSPCHEDQRNCGALHAVHHGLVTAAVAMRLLVLEEDLDAMTLQARSNLHHPLVIVSPLRVFPPVVRDEAIVAWTFFTWLPRVEAFQRQPWAIVSKLRKLRKLCFLG